MFEIRTNRAASGFPLKLSICFLFTCFLLAFDSSGKGFPSYSAVNDHDVHVIKDLAYYEGPGVDENKHKLDLYLPRNKTGFPMLMFVHGGAWRSGDRALYERLGNLFAREGFGVAVISYRLSPAVQHPAHIEDVARAFAWLHVHAKERNGNPRKIFISGHSAGAHLVALLALNEKYLNSHKLSPRDIAGVIALSGPYLIRGNLFQAFGSDETGWRDASPVEHVNGHAPPFLLLYADSDFPGLGPSARQLHSLLEAQRNKASLVEIKGRNHITIITTLDAPGEKTSESWLDFMRDKLK